MFDNVNNEGGRANCQDDMEGFYKQRSAQFEAWSDKLLKSYRDDVRTAFEKGDNLLTFKYGYMMAYTHPEEFEKIKDRLPQLSDEQKTLIQKITDALVQWHNEAAKKYPNFAKRGRPELNEQAAPGTTSVYAYAAGETATYSLATLQIYSEYIDALREANLNIAELTFQNLARQYGYETLSDAENALK
jgi:hypothetical protein